MRTERGFRSGEPAFGCEPVSCAGRDGAVRGGIDSRHEQSSKLRQRSGQRTVAKRMRFDPESPWLHDCTPPDVCQFEGSWSRTDKNYEKNDGWGLDRAKRIVYN